MTETDLAPVGEKPRLRIQARSRAFGGSFDGAGSGNRLLEGWQVGLTSGQPVGRQYERDTGVARIRDLENNDPMARSAIERRMDNVIGAGWGLTSTPLAAALGIDFEAAIDFAEAAETLWECYTEDPQQRFTVEENYSYPEVMAASYRSKYRDGEVFALLTMDKTLGPGQHIGTRLQLIDPDRVSNPNGQSDNEKIRQGIEVDKNGKPIAAHIRDGHPTDWSTGRGRYTWRRVPFRGPTGRPNLIHHFERTRIGQLRGVSRLMPLLKIFRAINVYDDAELQTKVANSVVGGFITSNFGVAEAGSALTADMTDRDEARAEFYADNPNYRKNPLGGRYPVLPTGDTFTPMDTSRDTGEDFVTRVTHNLAAAAGLTYQQLTMRLDKVNYSSFRGGLLEIYKDFRRDQEHFAKGFFGPWNYAVIEEAFARRIFTPPAGAPDFYEACAAYTKFKPILPPRGWVDPVKEGQAAGIRMNLDLSSLADEAAEQGKNWKDILHQKRRERAERIKLGLPVQSYTVAMSTNANSDKSETRDMDDNEHLADPDATPDDANSYSEITT